MITEPKQTNKEVNFMSKMLDFFRDPYEHRKRLKLPTFPRKILFHLYSWATPPLSLSTSTHQIKYHLISSPPFEFQFKRVAMDDFISLYPSLANVVDGHRHFFFSFWFLLYEHKKSQPWTIKCRRKIGKLNACMNIFRWPYSIFSLRSFHISFSIN